MAASRAEVVGAQLDAEVYSRFPRMSFATRCTVLVQEDITTDPAENHTPL